MNRTHSARSAVVHVTIRRMSGNDHTLRAVATKAWWLGPGRGTDSRVLAQLDVDTAGLGERDAIAMALDALKATVAGGLGADETG